MTCTDRNLDDGPLVTSEFNHTNLRMAVSLKFVVTRGRTC